MSELRRNLQINGTTYHLAVNQYGAGKPNGQTAGKPGVLYMDTETGKLYKCVKMENGLATWAPAIPLEPRTVTSDMLQEVGVDADGKLWTRSVSGSLHAAAIRTDGAGQITVALSAISLLDSRQAIAFGDKLVSEDGYLYEIRGISLGSGEETSYTGVLICKMGGESGTNLPAYWIAELEQAAQAINEKITAAGCNKAAFLCYSDAHWTYNTQVSPKLLNYLYRHTAMNKVVFCGDIVDDEEDVSYLWQWREAIKDLPNHHSVVGNHDDGNTTNNKFSENYVYGFLIAPEETPDMVRGGNGLYYYIDSPAERTRYLYLDTAVIGVNESQRDFVAQALKSTPDGWHIIAIAHIWYDANYETNPVSVGGINSKSKILLNMFDDYNRRTGEYADCGGWVEFCVGGHTHMDYSGRSDSGIPIILICTDSRHTRSGPDYEQGTVNESAVAGIIADFNEHKINIVGVGRCSDRWIIYDGMIDNGGVGDVNHNVLKDAAIGYKADTEISTTSGSERASTAGYDLTGYIPVQPGDIIRLKNVIMPDGVTDRRNYVYFFGEDKAFGGNCCMTTNSTDGGAYYDPVFENGNLVRFTIREHFDFAYIRINAQQIDETSVITVNEEIA